MVHAENAQSSPSQFITVSTAELTTALMMKNLRMTDHATQLNAHTTTSNGTHLMTIAICAMLSSDLMLPELNVSKTNVPITKSKLNQDTVTIVDLITEPQKMEENVLSQNVTQMRSLP
jgi:hypothetical protein